MCDQRPLAVSGALSNRAHGWLFHPRNFKNGPLEPEYLLINSLIIMTINGLHLELQSDYKKHHSTESALVKVKNNFLLNMDV